MMPTCLLECRYLMCLQLCEDIRSDRVHVDIETAIRLTAIMLQGISPPMHPSTPANFGCLKFATFCGVN